MVLFFNLGFHFLLSVYRKAIDFYVLMYSVILLNSLISTRSFVSVFLRLSQILWDFLHRQSSHLQINTVLRVHYPYIYEEILHHQNVIEADLLKAE